LKKYFGTDGIRGIPNENLTQDLISGMARAVEQVLGISSVAVIQDTRCSSKAILDWISKGFSEEVNVFNYGVLPSGSMPILISEFNHDLGIIISASHNPSEYNGVKLINKNGSKLSDELEIAIESEIGKSDLPNSSSVVKETEEGKKAYEQFLLDQIDFNIDNFNLVIDCANGSAYQVIEELFNSNKNIRVINNTPDGKNINHECGATYMENMVQNIKKGEIGISFDGDADRSILVDEEGKVSNGDVIMLLVSKYLSSKGSLKNNVVVSTVMSNFGFKAAVEKNNFSNIETKVGDKYVAEALLENNGSLGGEQSGHIIFPDILPVGDGLLTMLMSLKALSFFNTTLVQFKADNIYEYPQVLENLHLNEIPSDDVIESLNSLAEELFIETQLDGRYLIRKSGTEPLLRVLVEAKSEEELDNFMDKLLTIIKNELKIS